LKGREQLKGSFESAYLTVEKSYETPSALKVHRASRIWAISDGYIAWRIRDGTLLRNIMWNPKKDVVDFAEKYEPLLTKCGIHMKPLPRLAMLVKQFPVMATKVCFCNMIPEMLCKILLVLPEEKIHKATSSIRQSSL
jgi:hypothetical protein